MQENIREFSGRSLIRNLQQLPLAIPKIVVERMVNDHADKGPHDDQRLDFNHGSVALSLANVLAQNAIDALDEFFPEYLGQLVLFQRGMQKETMKFRVGVVSVERVERETFKHRPVIFARDCFGNYLQGLELVMQAGLMIENRAIEFLLGGKVAKDHRFGHAGGQSYFFCGGPAKATLGKQSHRHAQDLQAPLFAGHARSVRICGDSLLGFHSK